MYLRYIQGTTAIEGNTISLREAQELLEHIISPAGKKMDKGYEISPGGQGYTEGFWLKLQGSCGFQLFTGRNWLL
jgi:hypothetical protein